MRRLLLGAALLARRAVDGAQIVGSDRLAVELSHRVELAPSAGEPAFAAGSEAHCVLTSNGGFGGGR
jgi:hypothetical protein